MLNRYLYYNLCRNNTGEVFELVSHSMGTLGKGFAAVSLDKEHARQRRMSLNRPAEGAGEGLSRGGRRLVLVINFFAANISSTAIRQFAKRLLIW